MYQLGDYAIFTGDTLFLESVGRPIWLTRPNHSPTACTAACTNGAPAHDAIMVFPAHYGAAVPVHTGEFVARPLGELRSTLPALALSEDEFVAWAIASVKDRPPNYEHIVLVNAGREALGSEAAAMELGPNRCAIA